MFGQLLGELISLPLRVASIPLHLIQEGVGTVIESYEAPEENGLDVLANEIEEATNSLSGD